MHADNHGSDGERVTLYEGYHESVEVALNDGDMTFRWADAGEDDPIEMARFVPRLGLLRVFPRKKFGPSFESQFSKIDEFQFETRFLPNWDPSDPIAENDLNGSLELLGLPDGFGRIFQYGLGLRRNYRGIVHQVEAHAECKVVRWGDSTDEGPCGPIFVLGLERFSEYRRAVDRNAARGATVVRRANLAQAHNSVADLFELEPAKTTLGRHPLIKAMTREVTGETDMDADDRRMLVDRVSVESRAAALEAPAAFGRLRQDIELVSLEVLIANFERGLTGSAAKEESVWQDFFENNTFALQQLFAAPIALYQAQLTVKGVNALGEGSRIADFVLVNTVTRTAVVVEIKTPAARLTGSKYRGAGGSEVFLPHRDLLGSVSQIQAQMESVRIHLPQLLAQTPGAGPLDTCVVRGAVIVGTAGSLDEQEKASFLRFRDGLVGIEVIAFDEVRDRLEGLRKVLAMQDHD